MAEYKSKVKALCLDVVEGRLEAEDLADKIVKLGRCEECQKTTDMFREMEICSEQRTPKWKSLRKSMITASEVGTVLNVNRYETAQKLLLRKVGITTFKGNKFTQHGQSMEAAAIQRYEAETGHTVRQYGLLQCQEHPFLGGSPDGITACGRLLEVKCPVTRELIQGDVPIHYYHQVQLLLFITKLDYADYVEMKGPEEFQIVEVVRDPEWYTKHEDTLLKFHERLMSCHEDPSCLPKPKKRKKAKPIFDFGKNKMFVK